jgi:hypothetical protein
LRAEHQQERRQMSNAHEEQGQQQEGQSSASPQHK